jgi:hypothetical protein
MASLLSKLRTAALAFPGLTDALGGTNPNKFRWYDTQLRQGTAFPALVAMLISNPTSYTVNSRLATSFTRVQFELWGYDPVVLDQIVTQLSAFLDQFDGYGTPGLVQYANYIMNDRQVLYADTQPPQYQRIVDANVFNNSLIA